MSTLNSLNRSMLRLSGLSSGMDTDSMVTNMLRLDQMKVDKQFKIKTKLEWKGDAYRDLNLKIRSFKDKYMSVLSPDTNVFSASALKNFKASMLTDSSAVSITANYSAMEGNVTINKITALASAATAKSEDVFDGTVTLGTSLKDAQFKTGLTFVENDEGVREVSFTINGQSFTFNEDETIGDVINKVNRNADAGVTMSFSSIRNGFVLTSKTTGADSEITLSDDIGNAMEAFKFDLAAENKGTNAVLYIDGYRVEKSSNKFTVDGITYNLKETTDTEVKFNVERDIDTTMKKINGFIEGYNALIEELNKLINEKINRGYEPLTDEEKSALSEADAKKMEEMARSGLLRRDSNITNLLSNMRSAFYSTVEGAGIMAAEIGITTSRDYLDGGKIVVDQDKLRKALETNPEQVISMFTDSSSAADSSAKYKQTGIIGRISDAMTSYTKTINEITLESNKDAITKAADRLSQLEDWLIANEEKYWKQFTAMEKAMSSLNSQSGWLSSMLGSGK